jgi:hypothetical protein
MDRLISTLKNQRFIIFPNIYKIYMKSLDVLIY